MGRPHNQKLAILAAGALAALVLVVPLAAAATLTHDEYVARVEPICKKNTAANARIFKGVKDEVKAGQFEQASKRFERASTAFAATIKQINSVPKPTADVTELTEWVGYLKTEKTFLDKIAAALAAGQEYQAQTFSVRLSRNVNQANDAVRGFGFHYCQIDPSKFS